MCEPALEMRELGQDADGVGPCLLVELRDTHGVEIANDHAGGRRRVLDFGDDRRALRALDRAAKRTPLAPPLAMPLSQ